jgi:Tfp pilus assembly protein PilF
LRCADEFGVTHIKIVFVGTVLSTLAGGCGSDKGSQVERAPTDTSSIAEAPTPQIRAETYIAAGDLALTRGQAHQAAEQYAKALKARPDDPAVLKKLGLAQVKADQLASAAETFRRYVHATNGSADAFGTLGYCLELAGQAAEAEKTYLDGIRKHPGGSLVRINYGLMLVRRNQVDAAVGQMSAVLEPHEVNYNIASVYEQLGRRDLAHFYYRRALECKPGFAAAQQKLAMVD